MTQIRFEGYFSAPKGTPSQIVELSTTYIVPESGKFGERECHVVSDLPPTSRTKLRLVKSVKLEQDAREKFRLLE